MCWGLWQCSCFPLQSFVFMHLQTLFWGVPRHHQRVHGPAQMKTPFLSGPGGSGGPGVPVSPAPLLGPVLFRVVSFLVPVSWPLVTPDPWCSYKSTHRAVRVFNLTFASRPCKCSLTVVLPPGTGAMSWFLASLSPCPTPAPQKLTQCFGVLGKFCSECRVNAEAVFS